MDIIGNERPLVFDDWSDFVVGGIRADQVGFSLPGVRIIKDVRGKPVFSLHCVFAKEWKKYASIAYNTEKFIVYGVIDRYLNIVTELPNFYIPLHFSVKELFDKTIKCACQ